MVLISLVLVYFLTQTSYSAPNPQQDISSTLLEAFRRNGNHINNEPCICITLIRCPSLYSIISKHPVTQYEVEYLTSKTCGFVDLEPKVCCPEKITEIHPKVETRKPPRSTNHRRRMDRCLAQSESEDESYSDDLHSENSYSDSQDEAFGKPPYFGNHPPSFHPGVFLHRGSFPFSGKDRNMGLVPNMETPAKPNEVSNDQTTLAPTTIMRKKLLPDDTCGLSLDQRIIGGKNAKLGAYPWIARLGYTRARISVYLYRCGGVLINSRFVITAAHCIDDLPLDLKLATVRLGEYDERTDPDCEGSVCADPVQDFIPLVIISHRNYNVPKYKNDIGLIRLDREAVITPYVSPICLPYKYMNSINYTGLDAVATGWGTVNVETSANSPILQDVTLKISNQENCTSIYSSQFEINIGDNQFCTQGQEGKDTCEGDSGGPLIRFELQASKDVPRYFLIGIVSFGPRNCGTPKLPAVFTRVSSHIDWILYHIDDDYAVINK